MSRPLLFGRQYIAPHTMSSTVWIRTRKAEGPPVAGLQKHPGWCLAFGWDPAAVVVARGSRGAGNRIRTYDLRITNAPLYQLSYSGVAANSTAWPRSIHQLQAQFLGQREHHVLRFAREVAHRAGAEFAQAVDHALDQHLRRGGAGGDPDLLAPDQPGRIDLGSAVDQVGLDAVALGQLGQAVGIR